MASFRLHQEVHPAPSAGSNGVGLNAPAKPWGKKTTRLRFTRGVVTRSSAATLLAVVLASLTAAYLLLVCYRHLSVIPLKQHEAARVLASNFPDEGNEDGCSNPADDGDQENTPEDQAGDAPAPGPLPPMPPEVQQVMEGALHLLAAPVDRCVAVIQRVHPSQRRLLIYHLTLLAAVELSGFAYLPQPLQALRTKVARRYVDLNRRLLGVEPSTNSLDRDAFLSQVVQNLGEPPDQKVNASPGLYERFMVINFRLMQLANYNALNVINQILLDTTPTGYAPGWRVKLAIGVLKELYRARRGQILRQRLTRLWLGVQQERLNTQLFYSTIMFRDAESTPIRRIIDEYQKIFDAVQFAGGSPVSPFPLSAHAQYSEQTSSSDDDTQQLSPPPGMDLGAQGFPGSFPQEPPQGTMGDEAASTSAAHEPQLPAMVQVFPSGFLQQPQTGYLPGVPADYTLHGLSTGEGVVSPHAGPGGAAYYMGPTTPTGQMMQPGAQDYLQYFPQQPPQGAAGFAAPFSPGAQQSHFPYFPQQPPQGAMGPAPPFSPTAQQPTPPWMPHLPPGFMHGHPGSFLQVPPGVLGMGDGQQPAAGYEAGAAGFDFGQFTPTEATSASAEDDGVASGQTAPGNSDLQDADDILKLIDETVKWDITSDEEEE